jgi:hypothetical protein
MTESKLIQILAHLRQIHPEPGKLVSGHCYEFAFALKTFLTARGVAAEVVSMIKKTYPPNSRKWTHWGLSHQIVRALDTEWDYQGASADFHFAEMWLQHNFDETHHKFSYRVAKTPKTHRTMLRMKPFRQKLADSLLLMLEQAEQRYNKIGSQPLVWNRFSNPAAVPALVQAAESTP